MGRAYRSNEVRIFLSILVLVLTGCQQFSKQAEEDVSFSHEAVRCIDKGGVPVRAWYARAHVSRCVE